MTSTVLSTVLIGFFTTLFFSSSSIVNGELGEPTVVKPTNLLFIMFDDLRPELSIYGREHMITPNFERLAKRSVVFDYSFCQVAVCNPSRDSLMTGLRPDSVGTYNFLHSYWPHLTMPTQLVRNGYNTAGIGKLFHWETSDKNVWSFDNWDNNWYDYQGYEGSIMNSSTMPDHHLPIEKFRDSLFVDRAISTWKKMIAEPKPFMLSMGFKLPHLALHVPYKYYEMYNTPAMRNLWKLNKKELRFPVTSPEISYRCCAEGRFDYMNGEGLYRANRSLNLGDINMALPEDMHDELMLGYCAGTTFVDYLLGKFLDVMDEKGLWDTTTVILSADHGMHNGEKGIWEKWSLFEESTRVPLIIAHPNSPFKGQHYKYPTESIDIYATVNELLKLPVPREQTCGGYKCKPLQGKSLAPVVLGQEIYEKNFGPMPTTLVGNIANSFGQGVSKMIGSLKSMLPRSAVTAATAAAASTSVRTLSDGPVMPVLEHNFAISQAMRCVDLNSKPTKRYSVGINAAANGNAGQSGASVHPHGGEGGTKDTHTKIMRSPIWRDCDYTKNNPNEFVVLGYAMRTPEYRYIAYFVFNRTTQLPEINELPFDEELYDHKNETLKDFTHREVFNLAVRPSYQVTIQSLRQKLVTFIKEKVVFGNH